MTKTPRTRVAKRKPASAAAGLIAFDFGTATYQIDVARLKVYQQWVEVERTKQSVIISAYQASRAVAV